MGRVLTVENRTGEVTNELLEKVGLLAGDFVEAIALATLLDLVRGKTSAKLSVEDCEAMLAKVSFLRMFCRARLVRTVADSLVESTCMDSPLRCAATG